MPLSAIQNEFTQLKAIYQSEQKQLDKQHKRGYMIRRVLLLLILTGVSAVAGGYVYIEMGNTLGLAGFGLAGFFFLLIPFAYFDWKKRNVKLVASVREQKTQMRRLQIEGKEVQKRYQPLKLQIKALEAEYRSLRSGLAGGKIATVA
jgi:hypothetical protein